MKPSYLSFLLLVFALAGCTKRNSQLNYKNFKVLNVTLIAMPFSDSQGSAWDPFGGKPDVFFKIEGAASAVLYDGTGERRDDVSQSDLPLSWNFLKAYEIDNLEATHFVTIYDYDPIGDNDKIGHVGFTMNAHKSGYPRKITKSDGGVTVSITGEWY